MVFIGYKVGSNMHSVSFFFTNLSWKSSSAYWSIWSSRRCCRKRYPDLSSPAIMPVYSMAHTLRHPELPPLVVFSQGDIGGYVSGEQIHRESISSTSKEQ